MGLETHLLAEQYHGVPIPSSLPTHKKGRGHYPAMATTPNGYVQLPSRSSELEPEQAVGERPTETCHDEPRIIELDTEETGDC